MRRSALLLAVVLCALPAVASAAASCTKPESISFATLPRVFSGGGMQAYYCAASPYPTTVGDLSPLEWAKHVQVCTTNCSYERMSPTDPRSMLVATECGPGMHAVSFLVDPPSRIEASRTGLVDGCTNTVIPKGTAASPSPGGRRLR